MNTSRLKIIILKIKSPIKLYIRKRVVESLVLLFLICYSSLEFLKSLITLMVS